jgi:LEA14-like dessication related protein
MKKLFLLLLFLGIAGFVAWRYPSCRAAVEPHANVVAAEVVTWSLSEVEMRLDTDVLNPNPVSATVNDIPCQLTIGGIDMGTAHIPAGTTLKANATTRVPIPLHTPISQILALMAQTVERGAVRPYQVKCTLQLNVLNQTFGIPFEKEGWVDLGKHQLLKQDRNPEVVPPPP